MNVLVMGWASWRLFRAFRSRKPEPEPDALVRRMVEHDLVRLPAITAGLERKIYASFVTCLHDATFDHLRNVECTVFEHDLHVDVCEIPEAERPVPKFALADRTFFRDLVDVYVSRNPSLHVRWIPFGYERRIYENVLGLAMGVLEILASTVRVRVLGHELSFGLRTLDPETVRACLGRAHTTPTCSKKVSRALRRAVWTHVRTHPIGWIPERVHRAILYRLFRIVAALVAEVLETSACDWLGHECRVWFRPRKP